MTGEIERRTITFLFTDLEGSTAAWEADATVMAEAMRRHDEIVSTTLDAYAGILFKHTGDGVIATFLAPNKAVEAAVALQHRLADLPVRTRMGIHVGEVEARDDDYFGPEVNRSARVMGIAHGGQILVSQAVYVELEQAPVTDVGFVGLGAHRLKGLYRPEVIFQVQARGLHTDFPPPASLNATLGNLPPSADLLGRDQELVDLRHALEEDMVVSLIGPGGVGKTTLAIAAAREVEHLTPDGTWFVDLAAAEAGDVPAAFAEPLGISGVPIGEIEAALLDYLQARDLRLVVDNCEHVADEVVRVVSAIRAHAPNIRILATSRVRIGAAGVRSVAVRPLDASSVDSAAVNLFIRKAEQARPGIALADEMDAISEICAALDGLPLAIELAASRVTVLSPRDLLQRLDKRFALLRSSEKQGRALLATLEWSFDLLTPDDQELFVRLGVFRGPFDLLGAVAIGPDGLDEFDLLESLSHLVDSSLLAVEVVDDATLYRRLESVREFSALKFAEHPHSSAIKDRHLEEIERFGEHVKTGMHTDDCRATANVTRARMSDVRAAFEHALETEPIRVLSLVRRVGMALSLNGQSVAVDDWLTRAIASVAPGGDAPETMALLANGAEFAWRGGDHTRSGQWAAESLAMAERLGLEPDALALLRQATIQALSGNGPAAVELCEQVVLQTEKDPQLEGYSLGAAGVLIAISGKPERGMALAHRAVEASRRQGPYRLVTAIVNLNLAAPKADPELRIERANEAIQGARLLESRFHEGVAMRSLAMAKLDRGDADAHAVMFDSILLARDSGQRAGVITMLEVLAVQLRDRATSEAAALLAGCGVHRAELSIPSTPQEAKRLEGFLAEINTTLGEEADVAGRRGLGLSVDELVELAAGVIEHLEPIGAHD